MLLIKEPPQNQEPKLALPITATCHGNCPFAATSPLIMRPSGLKASLPCNEQKKLMLLNVEFNIHSPLVEMLEQMKCTTKEENGTCWLNVHFLKFVCFYTDIMKILIGKLKIIYGFVR